MKILLNVKIKHMLKNIYCYIFTDSTINNKYINNYTFKIKIFTT